MTMTEAIIKVGEQVRVDSPKYPGIWTITKVNQVTVKLEQNGSRLTCSKECLLPADASTAVVAIASASLPYQDAGAVVRYIGTGTQDKTLSKGALLIVIADKGEKVNVTLLGGNGGGYWRMPRRSLEATTEVYALTVAS
jgi:hypothetical protein